MLVLKHFDVKPEAVGQADCLHIIGRQAGLIGFFLSLMKIDPTTELKCNDYRAEVTRGSFFGRLTISIPIGATTAVIGGYQKPKALFFAMIATLLLGIFVSIDSGSYAFLLGAVVVTLIMGVFYILKKEMSVFVQNGGDAMWGLSFKRSVIEGVAVEIDKVNESVELINGKVLSLRSGGSAVAPVGAERSFCSECGSQMLESEKFCQKCGTAQETLSR
jgi:hypothetical protein